MLEITNILKISKSSTDNQAKSATVLIHPPYSPDIVPSNVHLFRSLQNFLNEKNFHSLEDCKRHLHQFFAQEDKKLGEDRTVKLPEKWQKV